MTEPFHIPSDNDGDEQQIPSDEGRLALDIFETEEYIYIVAPLAGVDSHEVDISIGEDVLTIRGKREFPEKLPEASNFFAEECFWGPFSRSIVLPNAIDPTKIKAKMKKNVLIVSVPKILKSAKKITIET